MILIRHDTTKNSGRDTAISAALTAQALELPYILLICWQNEYDRNLIEEEGKQSGIHNIRWWDLKTETDTSHKLLLESATYTLEF